MKHVVGERRASCTALTEIVTQQEHIQYNIVRRFGRIYRTRDFGKRGTDREQNISVFLILWTIRKRRAMASCVSV